jgi:hypothetical protein
MNATRTSTRCLEAFRAGRADTDDRAPERALLFNNLGITLAARAHTDVGPSADRDLTEAIAAHRSAVRTSSWRDRAQRLNNLAAALSERDRYLRDGDPADLDLAAARMAAAIKLTPMTFRPGPLADRRTSGRAHRARPTGDWSRAARPARARALAMWGVANAGCRRA